MKKITLHNGSELFVIPKEGAHSVVASVFVKSGSAHVSSEYAGLAHLVEHLFLRGTSKYPTSKDLTWELEKSGCNNDAWTDREFTYYFIQSPTESWCKAAEILLDRLQHSVFSTDDIEREKKIIAEEISSLERNGEKRAFNEWISFMENGSSYGPSILGTKESIQNISREQIIKYVNENYLSTNTIFTLTGNIPSMEEVSNYYNVLLDNYSKKLVTQLSQPSHPQINDSLLNTPHTSQIKYIVRPHGGEHVIVSYGFRITNSHNQIESATFQLIEALLLRGWSSRLKQRLRAKYGLIYKIDSKISTFEHTGYFTIVFSTSRSNLSFSIQILHDEFKKLAQEEIPLEELNKAKGYYNGQLSIHSDESLFLNYWYGKQLTLTPELTQTPTERKEMILSITSQDIQRISKRYFLSHNWSAVILENWEGEENIPVFSRD